MNVSEEFENATKRAYKGPAKAPPAGASPEGMEVPLMGRLRNVKSRRGVSSHVEFCSGAAVTVAGIVGTTEGLADMVEVEDGVEDDLGKVLLMALDERGGV